MKIRLADFRLLLICYKRKTLFHSWNVVLILSDKLVWKQYKSAACCAGIDDGRSLANSCVLGENNPCAICSQLDLIWRHHAVLKQVHHNFFFHAAAGHYAWQELESQKDGRPEENGGWFYVRPAARSSFFCLAVYPVIGMESSVQSNSNSCFSLLPSLLFFFLSSSVYGTEQRARDIIIGHTRHID